MTEQVFTPAILAGMAEFAAALIGAAWVALGPRRYTRAEVLTFGGLTVTAAGGLAVMVADMIGLALT